MNSYLSQSSLIKNMSFDTAPRNTIFRKIEIRPLSRHHNAEEGKVFMKNQQFHFIFSARARKKNKKQFASSSCIHTFFFFCSVCFPLSFFGSAFPGITNKFKCEAIWWYMFFLLLIFRLHKFTCLLFEI